MKVLGGVVGEAAAHSKTWQEDGIVVIDDAVTGEELTRLQGWVDDLEQMPGSAEGLLQYDEATPGGGMRRCRTENFVPHQDGLRELVTKGAIPQIAGHLLGEDAVLYKEKVYYKAPGGAGFAAHQDAQAYPFVRHTLACMIAVDDATVHNGCLEIARRSHQKWLPTDDSGCIASTVAAQLAWEPLPVKAGTLAFFHCHLPHRSGPNTSAGTRRAIYLTYNGVGDGNLREQYYAAKIRELATNPARLSLIGHFAGTANPVIGGDAR